MNDGFNIKTLGNQQLGLYYEITYQKINDIQIAIIDDIASILGKTTEINNEIYKNTEKFYRYCKAYRPSIQNHKKEIFIMLTQQQSDIHKEIRKRQMQMLKEIGITTPSIRVRMITDHMQGGHFPLFDNLIKYVKTIKKGDINKRPKEKKVEVPYQLSHMFYTLGTNIPNVLINNEGPMAN